MGQVQGLNNITDYGAFVELEAGEGLVHVSEMSWTKKNVHPSKIVSTSGRKSWCSTWMLKRQRQPRPGSRRCRTLEEFLEKHPIGTAVEGEVKNATEFGLFLGLDNDIGWSTSPTSTGTCRAKRRS